MKLTVNIATYLESNNKSVQHNLVADGPHEGWGVAHRYWRSHGDNISFLNQQLSRAVAELSDLGFGDRSTGAQLRNSSAGTSSQQPDRTSIVLSPCSNILVEIAHDIGWLSRGRTWGRAGRFPGAMGWLRVVL